jgi:hypothetical protein
MPSGATGSKHPKLHDANRMFSFSFLPAGARVAPDALLNTMQLEQSSKLYRSYVLNCIARGHAPPRQIAAPIQFAGIANVPVSPLTQMPLTAY